MITANVYKIVGVEPTLKLPAYTSFGCYPIVYLTKLDDPMCAECASSNEYHIHDAGIHWEGSSHICEGCGEEIESVYGEEIESAYVESE